VESKVTRWGQTMRSTAFKVRLVPCLIFSLGAGCFQAASQQQPNLNQKIEALLQRIKQQPNEYDQEIAGGDLVMLINQTKVTDIETKTIDDMAAMIGNGNSVVKIIISRVLGEIGPTANRAIPTLLRAAEEDKALLLQDLGIATGPETPYEAETAAIRRIRGEPEP
jgi:hypothetical protein